MVSSLVATMAALLVCQMAVQSVASKAEWKVGRLAQKLAALWAVRTVGHLAAQKVGRKALQSVVLLAELKGH